MDLLLVTKKQLLQAGREAIHRCGGWTRSRWEGEMGKNLCIVEICKGCGARNFPQINQTEITHRDGCPVAVFLDES